MLAGTSTFATHWAVRTPEAVARRYGRRDSGGQGDGDDLYSLAQPHPSLLHMANDDDDDDDDDDEDDDDDDDEDEDESDGSKQSSEEEEETEEETEPREGPRTRSQSQGGAPSQGGAAGTSGIDYSRWDRLQCSDDDDD